jgi:hypothetical protein
VNFKVFDFADVKIIRNLRLNKMYFVILYAILNAILYAILYAESGVSLSLSSIVHPKNLGSGALDADYQWIRPSSLSPTISNDVVNVIWVSSSTPKLFISCVNTAFTLFAMTILL